MAEGREDVHRLSEEELAELALNGNGDAWNEIARRHSRRVVVTLLARGVPLEAAEDLMQDTWVLLMERQRTGRLTRLRLPGLAIAQAAWLAREAQRTRTRRASLAGEPEPWLMMDAIQIAAPSPTPADIVEHREALDILQRTIEACSPRTREIFLAVYGPGARSTVEVARITRLSVQRVRQILSEVRARARRALAELEQGDPS